jgi:hypothetical protein
VPHICGEEVGIEEFETLNLNSAMLRAPPSAQLVVQDVKSDWHNASQRAIPAFRPTSKPAEGEAVQGNNKSHLVLTSLINLIKGFHYLVIWGKSVTKGARKHLPIEHAMSLYNKTSWRGCPCRVKLELLNMNCKFVQIDIDFWAVTT